MAEGGDGEDEIQFLRTVSRQMQFKSTAKSLAFHVDQVHFVRLCGVIGYIYEASAGLP